MHGLGVLEQNGNIGHLNFFYLITSVETTELIEYRCYIYNLTHRKQQQKREYKFGRYKNL